MEALFCDIGGVLLTNGWDRHARAKAALHFQLNSDEMENRHDVAFDTYETGKISLDEYLDYLFFGIEKEIPREAFKQFMYSVSEPYQQMLDWLITLKKKSDFTILLLSNEGRELMEYRVQTFGLKKMAHVLICSGCVHLRKPDPEIYHLALDITQTRPNRVIYLDDRPLLVETGRKLGLQALLHTSFEDSKAKVERLLQG